MPLPLPTFAAPCRQDTIPHRLCMQMLELQEVAGTYTGAAAGPCICWLLAQGVQDMTRLGSRLVGAEWCRYAAGLLACYRQEHSRR